MEHTVLVVEDEVLIRLDTVQHLEECGYRVLEAGDAVEAMGILAQRTDIDVVFTDVRMPGKIDGIGLAQWIVKNKPHIAVMIASGDAAKDMVVNQLCGAHSFSKPYNLYEVSSRIRELIAARRTD
jgi:DNA-binding NtrC family response regulator